MSTRFYDTDLTDAAWAWVAPVLPAVRPGGRPRTTGEAGRRNFAASLANSGLAPLTRLRFRTQLQICSKGAPCGGVEGDLAFFFALCVGENYLAMAARRQWERTVAPFGGNITFACGSSE
jgi:hypothetical protein